jgi:hypothetical protein
MSNQLAFGARRKSLLLCFRLVAFGVLLASSARAQTTTWIVTISVSGASEAPTYSVKSTPANAPTCSKAHPTQGTNGDVYVCQNDKVYWTAATKKDSNGKMQSEMFILHEDSILDKTGATYPTHGFHARDGGQDGGSIDPDYDSGDPHEYYVFVFDKLTQQMYVDDPKIIIGTGTVDEVSERLNDIKQQARQLRVLVTADPASTNEQKEEAIRRERKMATDVDKLKALLKSQ